MNETVSSDEEGYSNEQEINLESNLNINDSIESKKEANQSKDSVLESLSSSSLSNNISRHKGHVIIPLSKNPVSNVPNSVEKLESRIEPNSENLNISSSSLNEEEDEEPISIRHQKWSFTAAAMKNKDKACEGWNDSSSEDEDEFDQFIENRKVAHSTGNFNETNCIENGTKYCNQEFAQDHWQPFPFVSENQKTNDLFCSSDTGNRCIEFDCNVRNIFSYNLKKM